ncbi:MAG: polysaccharide biosynthesis tyrosine autokinase [Planctomycetota bacterium]
MNSIEQYDDNLIERSPVEMEMPPEPEGQMAMELIAAILRRWYIAVLVFVVICSVGIPVIWFLMEPRYDISGAIRVAPILSNILTGEADRGDISNYQSFMNTQAAMIVSPQVVQRVADDLAGKNLAFFENHEKGIGAKLRHDMEGGKVKPDPANLLKQAINSNVITAVAARNSELMKISMTSDSPQEAKKIVDAFIQAYMLVEVSTHLQGQDQKLTFLENERKVLAEKLKSQQDTLWQFRHEYGSMTLASRHDMMLGRVASLLKELTNVEAKRSEIETQIKSLEGNKPISIPEELLSRRNERIDSDPTVQELIRTVIRLEQDFIAAKQLMTQGNPVLKQKEEFLDAFKKRLDERRIEVAKSLDALTVEEVNIIVRNRLLNFRSQLEQNIAYEERLKEMLAKEDSKTIELGRKQLAIEELTEQLNSTKETCDIFDRRIQELEMERKQPARVSIAYPADISRIKDKRIQYTMALAFGALACGILAAFGRDKIDVSLHTPDDVVKRIGIRIIGTTTSLRTVERALLSKQIAEDYQTIRANLGLLDGGGIPRKLVITSPGMRDGKTTFAVNLATSLARSGKKVLLIDGDLRKPDIGRLLNIPKGSKCLQDALAENKLEQAVCTVSSAGLCAVVASSQSMLVPYELLSSRQTAEQVDRVSRNYDHVIIDTPPMLAFPDALLWAKMAGAVILTGFAGRTAVPDLKETKQRLAEIGVRILGTVLSNIPVNHSYYRYGYGYYSQDGHTTRRDRNSVKRPLLLDSPEDKKPDDLVL